MPGTPAATGRRRLSVVYLDHVARLSGAELALLRLLPHLDGVDRHVILAEHGPLVDALRDAGVTVEVLPLAAATNTVDRHRALTPGLRSLVDTTRYVLRLRRRLRELRPDVLHTNSLKACVIGSVAGRLAGVPQLWHARDTIDPPYLPARLAAVLRLLARFGATAVVANSRSTAASLVGSRPCAVVPSPLADRPESPERTGPGTPPGRCRFVMVGRLAAWKGQALVVEAFAQAFPDGEQTLTIVGSPMFGAEEEAYAEGLADLVVRLGLAERVRLSGFEADVPGVLARHDVLVHYSTSPEPFGQVVVEGMAAGLAVLASDEGGPADTLEHEVTGVLVAPRSVDALGAALRAADADPARRQRLGAGALLASRRYSAPAVAREMEQVYRQMLGETAPGDPR